MKAIKCDHHSIRWPVVVIWFNTDWCVGIKTDEKFCVTHVEKANEFLRVPEQAPIVKTQFLPKWSNCRINVIDGQFCRGLKRKSKPLER